MAGWVCQTKKLLVSAISSLAGELEQTVQDFNDAVHNFSTSRTERISKNEKDADEDAEMVVVEDNQDFSQLPAADHLQMDLDCPDQAFGGRRHQVATTRQPERTQVSATLNSRLSQSSPSLTSARPSREAKFLVHSHIVSSSTYTYRSLPRKSPSLSALSQSSPCLIHSTGSVKKSKKSCVNTHSQSHSQKSSAGHHQSPQYESNSDRQDNMLQIKSGVAHVQTCHRVPMQQKINHSLGYKRPGKVIRAATAASHNLEDITCYPDYSEFGDDRSEGSSALREKEGKDSNEEVDMDGVQSDQQLMIRASSPVLVEREQRYRIWSGLAPLTRILSFAFAQVANMVLMLTEDVQNNREQNTATREILSITYPSGHNNTQRHTEVTALEIQGRFSPVKETEDNSDDNFMDRDYETVITRSTLVRSPYSTDSFEIIESSCFDEMCDSVTDGYGFEKIPYAGQMETSSYVEAQIVRENVSVSRGFLDRITDMSSSAEFVNFDFRDLISNRHSNKLNPVTVERMSESSTQGLSEDDMCQSFYVICEKVPDMYVNDRNDDVDGWVSEDKNNLEVVDDDDDDESVSFTIISSENDEEDFQFY